MAAEKIPLVSVIIPMYNAAKFISQTLESLVYQTMKDFEVVVIDDCSTDNSVEVVESFADRVGEGLRLHVIKLPKNTGMPYLPRNIGINFACGKYLAFLDNDDLLTKTALEELTTIAEEYSADVVNMPAIFIVEDKDLSIEEMLNPKNYRIRSCRERTASLQENIFAFPGDISERIKLWLNNYFHWAAWATFCRRDFWINNQIKFPFMPVSDDTLANFACLCFAKKILSVPNITYIQRLRANSISREQDDVENFFKKWLSNLILAFKNFDEIMHRVPFFDEHLDYRYAVLDWFFNRNVIDAGRFSLAYAQIHPAALNQFVEREFHSDEASFAAYLFNTVNIQRLQLIQLQQENNALKQALAQK